MARLVVLLLAETDALGMSRQLSWNVGMLRLHLPPAHPMFLLRTVSSLRRQAVSATAGKLRA
jgi:hypothetical protein